MAFAGLLFSDESHCQVIVLLKKIFTAICVLTLAGCATFPFLSGELRMSADELTQKMQRRFPMDKNVAGLLEVTLAQPRVDLSERDNRVATSFLLNIKLPLTNKSLSGSLKVSGRPEYVAASRTLFLRDARVEQIQLENMSNALSAALAKAASSIARDVLEEKPLNVFKAEDFTRYGVQYEPDRIFVRGDQLVLSLKR